MNLIRVAGHIVNMDTVLYVEYGNATGEEYIRFNFSGPVQTVTDTVASDDSKWLVKGPDAAAFIQWLEKNSEDVTPRAAEGRQ